MRITKRQLRRIVSEEISKAKSGRLSEASRDADGNLIFREDTLQKVGSLDFDSYGAITLNDTIGDLATQVLEQLQELRYQGYDVLDTEMYASDVSDRVFKAVFDKIDFLHNLA